MRDSMAALFRSPLIPALAIVAIAWAIYLATADDPVLGSGSARASLEAIAVVLTAILVVLLAATALLSVIISFTGSPITGFQRVIVYAVLTFGATFITLRYLGFDPTTVLTTSAIATAAVGFAMQPVLSSMIAGLALHADRAMHVGDSIILDDEAVEITSINWRATTGRRADGRLVVIPNGKITDAVTQVLRASETHCTEFFFDGPIAHPPQLLCDLVRDAVMDLPLVDRSRAVVVAPVAFEPEKQALRLRVQYWVQRYGDRSLVEGEGVRRIWYVFQRNGIAFSMGSGAPLAAGLANFPDASLRHTEELGPAIAAWLARRHPALAQSREAEQAIAAKARLLLYAPGERIIMPEWAEGWDYVLFRGEARPVPKLDLSPEIEDGAAVPPIEKLGPTAKITHLADELSKLIGPYAKIAVMRAAERSQNYRELCEEVALEIDDPATRARFLRAMVPPDLRVLAAGSVVIARRNAGGYLAAEPALRARGELALLAIPPDAVGSAASSDAAKAAAV